MAGFIYFIESAMPDGGIAVKVGYSRQSPLKRLKQLQTGSVAELKIAGWLRGTQEQETGLHKLFANQRIRGEWFNLDGPVFYPYIQACDHYGQVMRGELAR